MERLFELLMTTRLLVSEQAAESGDAAMGGIHLMLPEDEVFLCGSTLLLGFVLGITARVLFSMRERRTA